jgi:hypothetical protein
LFYVLTSCLSYNTVGATGTSPGIPRPVLASINLLKFAMQPVLFRLKHARTAHLPIALRLNASKCLHLIQAPAQALNILDASTTSFYSTNGHRFGYAKFQVSETNPYQACVLFSIWDQGGCDQDTTPNYPASQVATTVACGTGIKCTDFGGEGTGRKRYVFSIQSSIHLS